MSTGPAGPVRLALVCAVSRPDVLDQRLAVSPCLRTGQLPWQAVRGARSAADAFNPVMEAAERERTADWLVWAHQDVFLPDGWDQAFVDGLQVALARWPNAMVAGVYGVRGHGSQAQRCGHVLDRGHVLRERTTLPCLADSLDELLLAVRVGSQMRMDATLGFDFYGTDLALQAQADGGVAVVVDAYCEHWSDTPSQPPLPASLKARLAHSGQAFERKWAHRLPVLTPCFDVQEPGSVTKILHGMG